MQADFYNAYLRHWKDAEYLYNDSRWPNADQLYGYSAECGLKCIMLQFGMQVDSTGTPTNKKQDKVHINKIWNRYEAYRAGTGASGYSLLKQNPFDNWDISDRYAHELFFNQSYVDPHRDGALLVMSLVNKAILEGILGI
jgi:hypothetical protein